MPTPTADNSANRSPGSFGDAETGPLAEALLHDSSSAVILVDPSLRVVDANGVALARRSVQHRDAIWRDAVSFLSPWVADERRDVLQEVFDSGRTIRLVGMMWGAWTKTTYRRIPTADRQSAYVLIVSTSTAHPLPDERDDRFETRRARRHDLGKLGRLTERELEVLRLIGQGLTTAEIARQLYRSVKTIEGHRLSLGYKLGAASRVELVRTATESGLIHLSAADVVSISQDAAASRSQRRRDCKDDN